MIKVGTCGWGFLKGGLKEYIKKFNVVEVNYTFYRYPRDNTLKNWKQQVDKDFEFTIKANKRITHERKFRDVDEDVREMKKICKALDASILVFQTPTSFKDAEAIEDFLSKYEFEENIVMELRGFSKEQRKLLVKTYGIVDCTDILKEDPVKSKFLYTRLHGLGKSMYRYKYTEDDLKLLKKKVGRYKKGYVMFNNVYMYEDADHFNDLMKEKTNK